MEMVLEPEKLEDCDKSEFLLLLLSNDKLIENKRVTGEFHFINIDRVSAKSVKNCVFEQAVDFQTETTEKLIFSQCSFKSRVSIKTGNVIDSLAFVNSEFDNNVSIHGVSGGWINFHKCTIHGSVEFNTIVDTCIQTNNSEFRKGFKLSSFEGDCHPKQLMFISSKVMGLFVVDYFAKLHHLSSEGSQFESVVIPGAIDECFLAGKESQRVEKLSLDNKHHEGKTVLSKLSIGRLTMSGFRGENHNLQIQDCIITNEWLMNNAAPQDFQAINLDLSSPSCKVVFDKSFLTDCIFSNMKWPPNKQLHSNISGKEQHLALREVYRELKHSSIRNSNHIDALAFYKNEMKAYRASGVKGVNDWLLMQIGYLSNNYGQNFFWPIWWLLGIHFILFWILVGKFDYLDFQIFVSDGSFDAFKEQLGHYLYFLNPVHKTPTDFSGSMLTLDFLMRLSSGFFIYHIIRASRKFAKV